MFETYSYLDDMFKFRNALDTFFNQGYSSYDYPLTNVYDDGEETKIYAMLPGVTNNDIDIELVDKTLTIKGERKGDVENKPCLKCERTFGQFKKVIKLPYSVNAENIKASLVDGILCVTLQKSEEAKAKKIAIN